MTSTLDVLDSDNVLNRGTVANDNTGDTLRSAGLKINNQFENVDSAMFNTSWAEWPAGVKETNSVLRYNGSKFVGTNNVKIDSDGNTTVSGTLAVSETLAVTSTSTFTDSATFSANVNLGDNDILNIGAGDDLQIYHDGSNSYIKDAGTGNLVLLSNNYSLKNAANNEQIISAVEDGAVELYYDAIKRIETTNVGGTVTGSLVADSATISGNLTANTISLGASGTISGDLTVDGNIILSDSDDITMPDRSMIKLGTDSDFAIHFDSNNHAVIETTKVNTPLVFKHNNVEIMRLTDSGVDISGTLNYDRLEQQNTIVLSAYGLIPNGTQLTDINVNRTQTDPQIYQFFADDTWDSVPINAGIFDCTKNVTKIRDLIDGVLNSSNQSAKYTVKVFFSVNTDTGTDRYHAVRLFGSNNHTISNYTANAYNINGLNQTGKRFLADNNNRPYFVERSEFGTDWLDNRDSNLVFIGDDNSFDGSQNASYNLDAGGGFATIDLSEGAPINFAMEIYQEKSPVPVYYDDITELK